MPRFVRAWNSAMRIKRNLIGDMRKKSWYPGALRKETKRVGKELNSMRLKVGTKEIKSVAEHNLLSRRSREWKRVWKDYGLSRYRRP